MCPYTYEIDLSIFFKKNSNKNELIRKEITSNLNSYLHIIKDFLSIKNKKKRPNRQKYQLVKIVF